MTACGSPSTRSTPTGAWTGGPLELVVADDQSNAEEGISQIERLVEDGVVAVGGMISSDVGLCHRAGGREQSEVPSFLVKAGSQTILTPDSRYTFRTCLPAAPMVAGPILQYAQAEGLTRVGAIIADYGWGRAIESALQETFADRPEHRAADRGRPRRRAGLHHLPAELGGARSRADRRHRSPAGSGAITVQSNDLGFDVPDHRRLLAVVARGRRRGRRRDRTLRRLRLRRLRERRSTRTSPGATSS